MFPDSWSAEDVLKAIIVTSRTRGIPVDDEQPNVHFHQRSVNGVAVCATTERFKVIEDGKSEQERLILAAWPAWPQEDKTV